MSKIYIILIFIYQVSIIFGLLTTESDLVFTLGNTDLFLLFRSLIELVVNQETTSLRHNIQINKRKHILINMDIKNNNKNITMHFISKIRKTKIPFYFIHHY